MKNLKNFKQLFLLLLIMPVLLNAQVSGFGSASSQLPDPNWTSGIHYMDDNRAKVSVIQSTLCNSMPGATLTLQNQTGTFQTGQTALLIQMKGGTIGTHQNVILNSVSGNSVCVIPVSGSIHSYSLNSGNDMVQLIGINEYVDLTMGGNATITCHPWNSQDGTGGILCFVVSGKLLINGGVINANGKGYTSEEAGITFGIGSTGGAQALTNDQQGKTPAPPEACLDGVGMVQASAATFTQGQRGGSAGNLGASKNLTSGTPINYGGSNKNTLLVMGDPGYYISGTGGSIGGQGGGMGGDGANSNCLFPNNPTVAGLGWLGFQGHDGGPAGRGGRGGGAVVIKADEIEITATHKVFLANGESGYPGSNGGNGGDGGMFGVGQGGCCSPTGSTPTLQGGNGGFGDAGSGGQGGDGGNGGKPGYIWVASQNAVTSTASLASVFSVKGGPGGRAGLGGWGNWVRWNKIIQAKNECTGNYCGGPGGCDAKYCDVLVAMQILASARRSHTSNDCSGTLVWANTSNQIIAEYNTTTGLLKTFTYNANCANPTEYRANLAYCNDLMKVLAGCMPNECGQVGTFYPTADFTQSLGIVLNSSFPIEIQYYKDLDPTSGLIPIPFIRFVWESENTSPYMEYMNCGNQRCYFETCPPLSNQNTFQFDPEFPPQQADPGMGGEDAPDGTLGNNPDDNVIVEDYATWIVQPTGLDKDMQKQLAVFIYPNPSRDILYLNISDMQSKQQPKVDIYDMTGKLITKDAKLMMQKDTTYKLDINYLPKGQYLLDIQIGNTTMHKTFTRQ